MLSTPYSALQHHAERPEEPWLFRSEGLDWRWHSWGDLARQAAAWASHLAGRSPGSHVTFSYWPSPESIVLDLGIMGAGLISCPHPGPSSPRPSSPAPSQPPTPGEEGDKQGDDLQCLPPLPVWGVGRGRERGLGGEGPGPEGPEVNTGGAVVQIEGSPVILATAELMALAEQVQAEIAAARRSREREIVVLGGALETPDERAMWTWATVTGAAVALEPAPELRIATAAWVRPTLFHGTAAEIAALRGWVGEKRKRGLPFGRLRTLLVAGGEAIGSEEAGFWQEWGVKLGRVPSLAAERHKHGI